ncbi:MAG: nitroreductase family protein [Solirubrobacteraceae bacterium]
MDECTWTAAARAGIAEARHARPIDTVEQTVRTPHSGDGIALAAAANRPTSKFAEVLERRRSDRLFGPLSFAELASVLVRCGRTRAFRIEISGAQLESRPLPSAGGRHPVSFEIVAAGVRGLADGHWRMRHELCELVPVGPSPLDLDEKLASMGFAEHSPPAIILVVADFGRTLRRYPAGASLVWRDAGVALGGLQLCATDLGLASCIVGSTGLVYPEFDPSGLVDIGALALGGLLRG